MPQPDRRLSQHLSVKQFAGKLEVSPRTVHRWLAAGLLPAHKIGQQIRIAEADAIAFVAARRRW